MMKRSLFFDFVMAGNPKGLKMPRGDKNRVMQFEIPNLSYPEQRKFVLMIMGLDKKVAALKKALVECRVEKANVVEAFLK